MNKLKLCSTDSVIVNKDGKRIEFGIVYADETISNGEVELLKGESLVKCTGLTEKDQLILLEELKLELDN